MGVGGCVLERDVAGCDRTHFDKDSAFGCLYMVLCCVLGYLVYVCMTTFGYSSMIDKWMSCDISM